MSSSLIKYLKPYKKECVLAPLFKLLEALLELFVPLVIANIIDVGIANKDGSYILRMCLLLIFIAFVGLSVSITAQYFSAKAASYFSKDVKSALFSKILSFSRKDAEKSGESTLITRLTSDVNLVQNALNMTLRLALRSPFVVFGAAIAAFTVDREGALIFAVAIPLLTFFVVLFMSLSMPLFKRSQAKLDEVVSSTRENLEGLRVIRAFSLEEDEKKRFKVKNDSLFNLQIAASKISALTNPVTSAIINISIIALLYFGSIEVNVGTLSQGELVALINYMSQILAELIKLANLVITISKGLSSANRIEELFKTESSMSYGSETEMDENSEYALVFNNVSFSYRGDEKYALKNISFKLKDGESLGIIGQTGSGKSTLASLIARLYDASSGEILLYGKDIKSYSKEELTKIISYAMQKSRLFKGSIESNLLLVKEEATDDEINNAINTARAKEFVDKKGLASSVSSLGKNLSGGQKQRMNIARSVLKDFKILILDDSSSALDYKTESELKKELEKLKRTMVVISQRASSVINADKILVLENGEIRAQGTSEELLASSDIYREIYYTQFEKGKSYEK